jgi:hypothetical protein
MKTMMETLLQVRLQSVLRRRRRLQLWRRLAGYWAAAALAVGAVVGLSRLVGVGSPWLFPLLTAGALLGAVIVVWRHRSAPSDFGALVAEIERSHPELDGLLLTATQIHRGAEGRLNFLAERVVEEAAERSLRSDWRRAIPTRQFALAHAGQWLALALLAGALWAGRLPFKPGAPVLVTRNTGLEVTPGDSTLERGSTLVVLVRFGAGAPESAELVLGTNAATARRLPLVRSLGDPVFGVTVPDLNDSFAYHIAYAGKRTRDYRVTVFEYPRLERSDADLTYPAYTGLPPKHIEDTRRVTAVEGSQLGLSLQLNKPVVAATLVGRQAGVTNLALRIETNRPAVALGPLPLRASASYELQLVDADGRTNKLPAQFVFEVQPNRVPELKLKAPRGDARPSPLEELTFDGTTWDDFGVLAFGLAFSVGGGEPTLVELGRSVPAQETRALAHTLRLEELGLQPDQLVAWFVWADDYGPDGEIRRTNGDLFFGEIRPFEEIFREGEQMGGSGGEPGEESGGGNPTTKLAELQKQIINATWKLQRQEGAKPKTSQPSDSKAAPGAKKPTTFWRGKEPGRPRPTDRSRLLASAGVAFSSGGRAGNPQAPAAVPATASEMNTHASEHFAPPSAFHLPPSPQVIFGQRAAADSEPRAEGNNAPARRLQALVDGQAKKTSSGGYEADVTVVHDAMTEAVSQAEAARERQQDPALASLWTTAIEQLNDALAKLAQAKSSPAQLGTALKAQQSAYEALLKVRDREFQVTRGQKGAAPGSGAGEQMRQMQLEQLDLAQADNRYESQPQAQAAQNPQRREEQQVLNRLRELAQRQEDLNERLKELQTALQAAKAEPEKDELRRQLKRLQEEQRQMLADTDELQQRMERPENQQKMAEQKQQLEQTREDLQRASEAANQGNMSQALSAGTRAQRQLQELRDELRKQNSSGLSEEMRQLRAEARDLARREEEIAKQLADLEQNKQRTLADNGERQKLADQLGQQRQRLTNLVNQAAQLSEQAEATEPLVARQLYDSIRKLTQDDGAALKQTQEELIQRGTLTRGLFENLQNLAKDEHGKALGSAEAVLREGFLPPAREAERRARATLDQLRKGVDKATENVLGDDTEALRLAEKELEALANQLEREFGPGGAGQAGDRGTNQVAGGQSGQAREGQPGGSRTNTTARAGDGQPGSEPQPSPAGQQGAGERPGNQQAKADQPAPKGQPGAGQQPSEQAGQPAGPQPGQTQGQQGQQPGQGGRGNRPQPANNQRGQRGGLDLRSLDPTLANDGGGTEGQGSRGGPITGGDFAEWSDRLRDVEEMVDQPDLRTEVSSARERARLMRQDFKRERTKPDWVTVQLQVVKPLVEVRQKLQEELARRDVKDSLVPIDRDPVPARYSELVRRYYEELGKDK